MKNLKDILVEKENLALITAIEYGDVIELTSDYKYYYEEDMESLEYNHIVKYGNTDKFNTAIKNKSIPLRIDKPYIVFIKGSKFKLIDYVFGYKVFEYIYKNKVLFEVAIDDTYEFNAFCKCVKIIK